MNQGIASSELLKLMTKEEIRFAKIKAALYAGGSMARLVRDAIAAYAGQLADKRLDVCPLCNKGKLLDAVCDHDVVFTIGGVEHQIRVTDIPAQECQQCKDVILDVILLAAVEEVLRDSVEETLRSKKSAPMFNSIRFDELLTTEKKQGW